MPVDLRVQRRDRRGCRRVLSSSERLRRQDAMTSSHIAPICDQLFDSAAQAARQICFSLSKPPRDVVLGALVLRLRRTSVSVSPYSTSSPSRKNAVLSEMRSGLLHVVSNDDDGILAPSAASQAPRFWRSRSGRARSSARPSAAPPAPRPAPARCKAAAAVRRKGRARSFSAGP